MVLWATRVISGTLHDCAVMDVGEVTKDLLENNCLTVLEMVRGTELIAVESLVALFIVLENFDITKGGVPFGTKADVRDSLNHDMLRDVVKLCNAFQDDLGPVVLVVVFAVDLYRIAAVSLLKFPLFGVSLLDLLFQESEIMISVEVNKSIFIITFGIRDFRVEVNVVVTIFTGSDLNKILSAINRRQE